MTEPNYTCNLPDYRTMADPKLIAHLATILHTMQQAVLSTAPPGGQVDPTKALGPMTRPWLDVRVILGLQGKWATLEETHAALTKAFANAAPAATTAMHGMSADFDFDPGWDVASTTCSSCGSFGKGPTGACTACGFAG